MIEIKDLLSKFSNLILREGGKKEVIKRVLQSNLNISIKDEEIKIKNGVVELDVRPIYKSEVLRKKDQILNSLNSELGDKAPTDIR